MAEKENKLELIASHHFMCQGTNTVNMQVLKKEEAVPVVVNVYRDGQSVVCCPLLGISSCEAPEDDIYFRHCPYETESRAESERE